jgi:uncharacterized membrane protein
MRDDLYWPIIPSCVGALILTVVLGALALSTWAEVAVVFLVFAIGLYFTISCHRSWHSASSQLTRFGR